MVWLKSPNYGRISYAAQHRVKPASHWNHMPSRSGGFHPIKSADAGLIGSGPQGFSSAQGIANYGTS